MLQNLLLKAVTLDIVEGHSLWQLACPTKSEVGPKIGHVDSHLATLLGSTPSSQH